MSKRLWLVGWMTCLIAVLTACTSQFSITVSDSGESSDPSPSSAAERASYEPFDFPHAVVTRVIDGDTIEVQLDNGDIAPVRAIGVDCPESVNPDESKNTEEGIIASDFTKSLLHPGDDVWLESDVSDTDKYGRLLRYIWMFNPDTTDMTFDVGTLNAELVYYGYAEAKDYPPDTKHSEILHTLADTTPYDTTVPIGPYKTPQGSLVFTVE